MFHRLVSNIGLGNPDRPLLRNKGKLNEKFAQVAVDTYFQKEDGFDFMVHKNCVSIGIEPTYQYERMLIINICRKKEDSHMRRGKAWGPYGSQVVKETKFYRDYKYNSKFKRFVDTWHSVLFPEAK